MRFRRQMHHRIRPNLIEQSGDTRRIADVELLEPVPFRIRNSFQTLGISGIGEFVKVAHLAIRLPDQEADQRGTDKPSTATMIFISFPFVQNKLAYNSAILSQV